ncbi:hypothetical protein BG004_006131 [Podila humilis]|nr:hypothetical protein BG004_006131 [Podila humilis]
MRESFTLGQLASAGAVGLLTGYLISKAIGSHGAKAASANESKDGKKKSNNKDEKRKQESVKPVKMIQIEEDSEDRTDDDDFSDEEEESEDEENKDLADFDQIGEEHKMVLVIRTDLAMGKGKAAAQCCHATLANYKEVAANAPKTLKHWEYYGQAKVTLKIDNEDDMLLLQAQARSVGLAAHSIRDAGRTQIAAGSRTVLAVGPGPVSIINGVTGHLKLY